MARSRPAHLACPRRAPRVLLRLAVVAVALLASVNTNANGAAAPAQASDSALAALSTAGNHIVRLGVPFNFYGVNRDTLEWGNANWGGCGGDGHFRATDFAHIAAWHATAVRIALSEADWLGRRCAAINYPALVDAAVAAANAQGLYAILDLHWSDVNGLAPCDRGCLTGEQPMPDADSVRVWTQVAARYANRPGVIFDLYNEPHDVPWACWRSGGCTVASSTPAARSTTPVRYTAVGMQTLLDAVRHTGATNLVLAAGLDWAYDLSGVLHGYALSGTNVAYDSHIYTHWHSTRGDWDSHVGIVARSRPVTVTELGSTDCSTAVTAPLLRYLSAPMGIAADRISWAVWSWNSPGSCSQPSLIADWHGTPLAGQGSLIHATLASLWSSSGAVTNRTPPASRRAGSSRSVRRTRVASRRGAQDDVRAGRGLARSVRPTSATRACGARPAPPR